MDLHSTASVLIVSIAIIIVVGFAVTAIIMGWQIIAEFLLISIPITNQKRGLKSILKVSGIILAIVFIFLLLLAWRLQTL